MLSVAGAFSTLATLFIAVSSPHRSNVWAAVSALAIVGSLAIASAVPVAANSPAEGQGATGATYLLAIGVCPPYRAKDVPVQVCRNAVKAIVDNFPEALSIPKQNVISMLDEDTTASSVLEKLSELTRQLQSNDRLLISMVLHGDPFSLWARYYQAGEVIQDIDREYYSASEDLMVFWTKEEPSVPALAVAQKQWLTVSEFTDALEAIPGQIGLILDSCSSNLYFSSVHKSAKASEKIDFVVTSSGSLQASSFDEAEQMPLFTQQLRDALNLPNVKTLGQAVEQAKITTTLHSVSQCIDTIISPQLFQLAFPQLAIPSEQTHDGNVSVPSWYCSQVPGSVDYTGEMSQRILYQGQASK